MNFDLLAKDLLNKETITPPKDTVARANVLLELANSGFSVREICNELRTLYDNTEEDGIKKQVLEMIVKVHGLYDKEDHKEPPKIVFNFGNADPERMNKMLCPVLREEAA